MTILIGAMVQILVDQVPPSYGKNSAFVAMPKRKLGALEKVDADLLVIRTILRRSNLTKSTAQTSSIKFEGTQRKRVDFPKPVVSS